MTEYKPIDKGGLTRLSEAEVQALGETDKSIKDINELIEGYRSLIKCLEDLPGRQNEEVMVPFGKVAYMPGRLDDTGRVTMSLGDGWFAQTPTGHAQTIAQRRIEALQVHLDKLKEQRRLFESRFDYTKEFIKEKEDFVEIVEQCTEEEYEDFKRQHRESVRKSKETKGSGQNDFDVDDFFGRYHDDEEEGEGCDPPKVEEFKIHEGYMPLLNDLGIDCTDLEFVTNESEPSHGSFTPSGDAENDLGFNKSDLKEENHPTPNLSLLGDILEVSDGDDNDPDIDEGICKEGIKRFDKSLSDDKGFQLLLTKLSPLPEAKPPNEVIPEKNASSFGEVSTANNSVSGEKDGDVRGSSISRENSGQAISNEKPLPADEQGRSLRMKKSVSWKDDVEADDNAVKKAHDGNHSSDEDEGKPATLVVKFKHSKVAPKAPSLCSSEGQDSRILIETPSDIYVQLYKPQSILKPTRESPQAPRDPERSTQRKAHEPPPRRDKLQSKSPPKPFRPAVLAKVVERIFDPADASKFQSAIVPRQEQPLVPTRVDPKPRVSMFKRDMTKKSS